MDKFDGQVRWTIKVDELGLEQESLSTAQSDSSSFWDKSGGQVRWTS